MKSKRTLLTLSLVSCLALGNAAQAANAPTSQFGFSGWPYRQNTSCGSAQGSQATVCPVSPQATCEPTRSPEATQAPSCTESPELPCTEPADCPTTSPTKQPQASVQPTLQPQQTVPTEKPQASLQPTVTAKPTATAKPTQTLAPTTAPTVAPMPTSTDDDYTTVNVSAQEENAYRLLNQDRTANGRSALTLDAELCRLARMKSTDMFTNNYFAHTSPTLGSAADMLRSNGYAFTSVGENIAHHATVEKSQAAFMSSSGHRTNILGSQWTKVGVGVCYDRQGFVYVTQLFVR